MQLKICGMMLESKNVMIVVENTNLRILLNSKCIFLVANNLNNYHKFS